MHTNAINTELKIDPVLANSVDTGDSPKLSLARMHAINHLLKQGPVGYGEFVQEVHQLIGSMENWLEEFQRRVQVTIPEERLFVNVDEDPPYDISVGFFPARNGQPGLPILRMKPMDIADNGNRVCGPMTNKLMRLFRVTCLLYCAAREFAETPLVDSLAIQSIKEKFEQLVKEVEAK